MNKLDILSNIDIINYIVQDSVRNVIVRPLVPRSNFYVGDGYAVDLINTTKTKSMVRIRSTHLQDLCKISLSKDEFLVRFNHQFMFQYKRKTGMYSTPLFEEPFLLEELEARFFTENCVGFNYSIDVKFDFEVMLETLELCKELHNAFLSHLERENTFSNT